MALELMQKETYLAMVQNSVGSHLFRSLYAKEGEQIRDILEGGNISCAFFVSSVLFHFGLVKAPHATIAGLVRDLETSGWRASDAPKDGDVLLWEPQEQASGVHAHVGFSLSGKAISHVDRERAPAEHDLTFGGTRKLVAVYTHDFLN